MQTNQINKILNVSSIVFLVSIIFGLGFYLGYKNSQSQIKSNPTVTLFTNTSSLSSSLESYVKDSNVFWIKPGEIPACPQTHLVKGRVDNNANIYYTIDSKSYNRVVPDLCFSTEEFARDVSGFIKKY
jgi:hypothetical protein